MRRWILLLIPVLFLAACSEPEPEPPPEVEEEKPPSPQEIASQVITQLGLKSPIPPPGSSLPPNARGQFLQRIQQANNQHSGTPQGQEALKIVSKEVENRIRAMEQNELWEHVWVLIDAYKIFNPNSTKFDYLLQKAKIELAKPKITIKGFPERKGLTMIMLDIYLPLSQETHRETMRVGEEKHGIRIEEIIGKRRGIRVKYLETGDDYEVYSRQR